MRTPSAACAECRELIGGYVLAALDPGEMHTVSRHLEECRDCAAEHARLGDIPVMLDLAGATEAAYEHPPAQLEEAVLDRFAREHPTPAPAAPRRSLRSLTRPLRRPLPAAAMGAIAAAAITAAITLPAGNGVTAPSGEVFKAQLTGGPVLPAAKADARLQTVSSGTHVHLRVNGLPGRPEDLYELWCVRDDGTKISAGTFRVDGRGRADVQLTTAAAVGDYHRLSVERKARPPAVPKGQRVMAGQIQYGTY
jgi:anti-sigma-K factor RskA